VERPDQAAQLREYGYRLAQGDLFGRPMPVDDMYRHLTEQRAPNRRPIPGAARAPGAERDHSGLITVGCTVLAVVTLLGQAVGVAQPSARPWILAVSVPLLDALGVWYSVRAARRTAQPVSWWLSAGGRLCSVVTTFLLVTAAATGDQPWWWVGTISRLLMFALLAAALLMPVGQMRGRGRRAFVADLCTLLAAGFMPMWYFLIGPVITATEPSHRHGRPGSPRHHRP
jgi:hypothetical protein